MTVNEANVTHSDPDWLLTPKDTAQLLGVAEGTLAAWRHQGRGPAFVKLGRSVRYRRADLHTFLDAQTRQET